MKVFISYKWEDDAQNMWVENLAKDLRIAGIDALLDKWEVSFGDSFTDYMTSKINEANAVLFIITPASVKAVEAPENEGGAVKFEMQMATARKISGEKMRLIGIYRSGDKPPHHLRDRRYSDFRDDSKYFKNLHELIDDLNGKIKAYPLGGGSFDIWCFNEKKFETRTSHKGDYELVKIPKGSFFMGSTSQGASFDELAEPIHEVEISQFYLGTYPVSNAQYKIFIDSNSEKVKKPIYWYDNKYNQPNQPVVGISYKEAKMYCDWAGLILPSEAQWEYACRGNTDTPYWCGESEGELTHVAWLGINSNNQLHPVGEKLRNPFGLFDMHGNTWEWCRDSLREYSKLRVKDPLGSMNVYNRSVRGGSFNCSSLRALSSIRRKRDINYRSYNLGFRAAWSKGFGLPSLK
ncbi:MAG: hypothetical protein DHS20C18_32360 [Saprospiraceae bacterium]|nr:MAG: hypothetical protein DHS20C18_32360 [Saprospiraceae bacterium]